MHIENQFELPLPPATAWPILMDVPQTAACFPGASLIEAVAENHYQGRVTVKLGPLTLLFSGSLRIEQRDNAAHSATVKASWSETKGRGNANTMTQFALHDSGAGTRVVMRSDLQLAGQVAQYGRGVGMIAAVSEQLIAAFAENLRATLQTARVGDAPAPSAREISGLTLMAKALGSSFKR